LSIQLQNVVLLKLSPLIIPKKHSKRYTSLALPRQYFN